MALGWRKFHFVEWHLWDRLIVGSMKSEYEVTEGINEGTGEYYMQV